MSLNLVNFLKISLPTRQIFGQIFLIKTKALDRVGKQQALTFYSCKFLSLPMEKDEKYVVQPQCGLSAASVQPRCSLSAPSIPSRPQGGDELLLDKTLEALGLRTPIGGRAL